MSKKYNRFDFEQEIMDAWGVVEDLKSLANGPKDLTKAEIEKALAGMAILYAVKFEKMFKSFEKSIPHTDANQGTDLLTDGDE